MPERLCLGQIDTANPPVTGGGAIYRLSEQYGTSAGNDVPMLVETSEVAPAGPVGQALMRRIEWPIEYDAACTVTVTPIGDYNLTLTSTTKTLASPLTRQTAVIAAPLSKIASVLRARITVVSRAGQVTVRTPSVLAQPKTQATPSPAQTT